MKEYSIEFLFIISNSDLTEASLKVGGKSSLELVHSTSVLQGVITRPILLNEIIFITLCMVDWTGPPPPFAANLLALASSVDGSFFNPISTISKAASF